jgi:hypothetical protein
MLASKTLATLFEVRDLIEIAVARVAGRCVSDLSRQCLDFGLHPFRSFCSRMLQAGRKPVPTGPRALFVVTRDCREVPVSPVARSQQRWIREVSS